MKSRLVLLLVFAAACKSGGEDRGDEKASGPEPIPQEEVARGDQACHDLAVRTCRCAQDKPELAAACQDAMALPEALRMGVQAAEGKDLEASVVARLQYEARATIAHCFEKLNDLVAQGCR
ncbi:MAG TPA: hypothetical protein VL172_19480 [Kofleriaceae bacterium]|nr:hypothetical protein [Kofleriaceae bacterium]